MSEQDLKSRGVRDSWGLPRTVGYEKREAFLFSLSVEMLCTGGWSVGHHSLLTFHCLLSPVPADNLEVPSWLFHSLPGRQVKASPLP